MRCVFCGRELERVKRGGDGVDVAVCRICGGMWRDGVLVAYWNRKMYWWIEIPEGVMVVDL